MKKLILGMSLLITTSGLMAQTASVQQQITVTQDTVRMFVDDLYRRNANSGLRLTDYRSWESGYKTEMEKNFVNYETNLKQRVFGPILEIVERYKSIYENKNLEKRQKEALLNSIVVQLESMKPGLEKEYARLLNDLYFSHNLFPKALTVTKETHYNSRGKVISSPKENGKTMATLKAEFHTPSNSDLSIERNRARDLIYLFDYNNRKIAFDTKPNHSSEWRYDHNPNNEGRDTNYDEVHNKYKKVPALAYVLNTTDFKFTHQRIVKGCESKSCVILKASDAAYIFQSISSMLDKEITIKLPNESTSKSVVIDSPKIDVSLYVKILSRTDLPKEIEQLPFDI